MKILFKKIGCFILFLFIILLSFVPFISIKGWGEEELTLSLIKTISFSLNSNILFFIFHIFIFVSVISYFLFSFLKFNIKKIFLEISLICFSLGFLILLVDFLFLKAGLLLGIPRESINSSKNISFNPLIFFLYIALFIIYFSLLSDSFKINLTKTSFFYKPNFLFYVFLFLSVVFSFSFKLFGLNVLINFFPLLFPFVNLLLRKEELYLITSFSMYSLICSINFNAPQEFLYLLLYTFYFLYIFFKKEPLQKFSSYFLNSSIACFVPVFLNIILTIFIYNNFNINFYLLDFIIYLFLFILFYCLELPFIYLILKRKSKFE